MRRKAGLGGIGLALGLAVAGCSSGPSPEPTAANFLGRWANGNVTGAASLTDHPVLASSFLTQTDSALRGAERRFSLGSASVNGSTATALYAANFALAGLGEWRYRGTLHLASSRGQWRVIWSRSDVYPGLGTADSLSEVRSLPPRAPVLGPGGVLLMSPQPVVTVGIVPGKATGLTSTLSTLAAATGIDPNRVSAAVKAAQPDAFVPAITLRRAAYDAVKAQIYALPGVEFEAGVEDLAPTPTFGLAILGRVGPATADALAHIRGPYLATDQVGLSGLELAYQDQLAGTPSGAIRVVDGAGRVVRTVVSFTGRPGQPLETTIDPAAQAAAEAALSATVHPAALVAVRASTGAVLAAASTPPDSTFDRALDSEYPPGSSFKVVTTTALLQSGLTPGTSVPCPPQVVIDGKPFKNFEGEAPGSVNLARDFAVSCNTAFVSAASRLPPGALTAAANFFGFGQKWSLPLPTYAGQVPPPRDPAEQVADAIGQGRVLASPLNMALVAATVASGEFHEPSLVVGGAGVSAGAPSLPPAVAEDLRTMMRGVVTSGTGTAANIPGAPVYGKTGTAEFGTANPPQTHAWFIGFRGDLAFAVLVDGGGVGGAVAAPLAARFLAGFSG
ncbi:MAG TPA: penicillin-binding transpeptidase domain-containing protein [Acidimicrobiales bacterium]|nr:penicillin-binding transpeptidase domain-containing protein [Acidimicrobiales bacterium]